MPQQGNRAECKGENASKRRAHAKMQDGNYRGKLDGCVTLRPLVLTWRPGKPVLYICRKYAQKKTSTYMGSLRWLQQRRFSCSKQGFSPAFCFPRDNNIFFVIDTILIPLLYPKKSLPNLQNGTRLFAVYLDTRWGNGPVLTQLWAPTGGILSISRNCKQMQFWISHDNSSY
jgi:hypothetical protein